MTNTTISFADEYQIFCCQSVTEREPLVLSTDSVPVALGQQITLNEAGNFSTPVSGDGGVQLFYQNGNWKK